MTLQCPRCESTNVVRLPKNDITPHPGYQCVNCQLKMRAPGMVVLYVAGLLVGVVLLAATVDFLFDGPDPVRFAKAAAGGVACVFAFWYSLVQLLQPTPRTPDDRPQS